MGVGVWGVVGVCGGKGGGRAPLALGNQLRLGKTMRITIYTPGA